MIMFRIYGSHIGPLQVMEVKKTCLGCRIFVRYETKWQEPKVVLNHTTLFDEQGMSFWPV